jgi:hypothetical protein
MLDAVPGHVFKGKVKLYYLSCPRVKYNRAVTWFRQVRWLGTDGHWRLSSLRKTLLRMPGWINYVFPMK